jgi:hypothetical protein
MEVPKTVVEALAKAWLEEAKRLQSNVYCDCGCGKPIPVTRFKPGHDAKLLRGYRERIRGILQGSN